jgi:hypothetical protein
MSPWRVRISARPTANIRRDRRLLHHLQHLDCDETANFRRAPGSKYALMAAHHSPNRGTEMFDYCLFSDQSKAEVIDKSIRSWNPEKTRFWLLAEVDLVIDRREGYFLYDVSGRRLIDMQPLR